MEDALRSWPPAEHLLGEQSSPGSPAEGSLIPVSAFRAEGIEALPTGALPDSGLSLPLHEGLLVRAALDWSRMHSVGSSQPWQQHQSCLCCRWEAGISNRDKLDPGYNTSLLLGFAKIPRSWNTAATARVQLGLVSCLNIKCLLISSPGKLDCLSQLKPL